MEKKKKVLLLDDEGIIRDLLQEVLEGNGYEVITSGSPGVTAIKAYKAHAIVLDLHMSRSNEKEGLNVLIHLWKDEQFITPIIIFSAYAGFEETINEITKIEKNYGNGRKVFASISKADGIATFLKTINDLFGNQ
jgi:CheY-like chemotaxis protein